MSKNSKEDEKTVPIYWITQKSVKQELDKIAVREDVFVKDLLNNIVTEYVKAHKDGNNQHLISNWIDNGEDFIGFPSIAVTLEKKKEYIEKFLQADGKLNELGKELWNHICEWSGVLKKL